MPDYYYLDENECPRFCELEQYENWFSSIPDDKKIGHNLIVLKTDFDDIRVITAYTGCHFLFNEEPDGKPLLWSTTVLFKHQFGAHVGIDSDSKRNALDAHRRLTERYSKKQHS